MKPRSIALLMALLMVMIALVPFVISSGAVTIGAHERYMESMPVDDEYAFLYE